MTEKRIVVIHHDGTEEVLPDVPSRDLMTMIVGGGRLEHVRVLREDITDAWVYTSMYVNETGLMDGLPRNQKATDIYLANMRRQYPDKTAREARDAATKAQWGNTPVIDVSPEGYADDPYIAGNAIWFDGYTVGEADALLNGARS